MEKKYANPLVARNIRPSGVGTCEDRPKFQTRHSTRAPHEESLGVPEPGLVKFNCQTSLNPCITAMTLRHHKNVHGVSGKLRTLWNK